MRATTRNRGRRSAVAALSVVTLGASLVLAATPVAAGGPSASIILGEVNEENGLRQIEQGDGTTAPVTVGGLSARATVQTSAPAEHMYFQVDDAIAFDGAFVACLQVEYFDEGGATFRVQYDSTSSAYGSTGSVNRTGSNTWKTAGFELMDARFANRENGGADFRVEAGTAGVTLHSVKLTIIQNDDGVTPPCAAASPEPEPVTPDWQLKYVEQFGKPIRTEASPWVLDNYSEPVDDFNDDNGDLYRLQLGPEFDAAMATMRTYRQETKFGRDGWLTASLSARESGGRVDDSYTDPAERPSIVTESLKNAGSVAKITVPNHTGGAIIRNTEPLPKYYRIEYDLKTLDFGGLRNGSLFYDGKYNGYALGECKTFYPWVGDPNDIEPADPCATHSVREDSNEAYNAFHFMSILDFPAMPRNLAMYHWHRKVLMDQFSPAPSRNTNGYDVCNSRTGEKYPWDESNRTTVNMLYFTGSLGQSQTFVTSCDRRPVSGVQKSAVELQPELMPKQDYTFAIERTEAGYTLEVSGNFKNVGKQTYRFTRGFIDDDAGVVGANVPIFHYNVDAEEYDGQFNTSHTARGAFGSKTWDNQWPAGSAYPDYFVIGEPYTNVGEGQARIDNIRLYVPKK
ncbi:mucin-5B [Sphaerisporangium album]|uniref:mucin-5B n=1 Tax=Sphaerisporangium album TaxID=509200 RepID=UPI0011C068A6|nr:mucin-5B [Sphaerisporangium album]